MTTWALTSPQLQAQSQLLKASHYTSSASRAISTTKADLTRAVADALTPAAASGVAVPPVPPCRKDCVGAGLGLGLGLGLQVTTGPVVSPGVCPLGCSVVPPEPPVEPSRPPLPPAEPSKPPFVDPPVPGVVSGAGDGLG